MSDSYSLKVSDIERLTHSSVKITFNIPDDLRAKFYFIPGQYITIQKEINGEIIRRPYSICSIPEDNKISIAIKKIANGKFSTYANEILQNNEILEVFPPEGRFIFLPETNATKNLGLFAAGSGITPIMSILKFALAKTNCKVALIYGNRTMADIMFLEELLSLREKYFGRFFIQFVQSQEPFQESLSGRINENIIDNLLKNTFKELNLQQFYSCGPEPMTKVVRQVLLSNLISEENIFTELFSAKKQQYEEKNEGKVKITFILDRDEVEIEANKSKSILDIALEQNLDAPYSCQGGICSTCMAKIIKGEVEMKKNQVLNADEVAEGLVLTCQSYALTEELIVDYDDI